MPCPCHPSLARAQADLQASLRARAALAVEDALQAWEEQQGQQVRMVLLLLLLMVYDESSMMNHH